MRATAGTPPPWPVEARLFGSDQVFAHDFGSAVALDGTTAIVGARNADIGGNVRQGAAYVFVREGDAWVEQAQLLAHDGAEDDRFGWSVGLDGDSAVVGARDADVEGQLNQGAVYVYLRVGTEWVETTKLVASDGDELDSFGHSVAIEGDTLVVGATGAQGASEGCDTGAAYVFAKEGVPWLEQVKLLPPDLPCDALLGSAVAVQGGRTVAGAPLATIDGVPRGAAYVFAGAGSVWDLEQELTASDGESADLFGDSLAIHGSRLLIGAWQNDIDGQSNKGAAYVLRRSDATWTEETQLTPSVGQTDGFFGRGTAILDGLALVGAQLDFPGDNERGVVYEYREQGAVWVEIQSFAAPNGNGIDLFGRSIALSSDRALIAHSGEAVLPPVGGSAWVFGRPVLFEDGFETGDTAAWNQTVP